MNKDKRKLIKSEYKGNPFFAFEPNANTIMSNLVVKRESLNG